MWKIKCSVLEAIVLAAQNTYPDEFIAFLGGNKKKQLIEELLILPSVYGSHHAIIRADLLPLNLAVLGSVHSHPGYSTRPSRADKGLFNRYGNVHLIICLPFSMQSIQAYNEHSAPIKFDVVK